MSRFLVTGGAGFIGGHIVEELVRRRQAVRVLDNFTSGNKKNLAAVVNKIELVRGDIRSKPACLKAAKGVDFILHQAALRSVPKSMRNPGDYNEVNIGGTLNMLQAALANKVKCFVFASSSSVYGQVSDFPERESSALAPISPYALTKLSGEHYCKIFSLHYGLPTVCLRYFNVFGPRQSLDDEYAVVIPKFINCMLKGRHPPIFGNGRQSRDFTYVSNVVEANILAAKLTNLSGQAFNIASGKDYTILQLVKLLNKLMGKSIRPVFLKPRSGDVFKTLASLSLSRSILGFRPKVDFIKGLELCVKNISL